jgi:hypothetical protein
MLLNRNIAIRSCKNASCIQPDLTKTRRFRVQNAERQQNYTRAEDNFLEGGSLLWSKELDPPVVIRSSGVNPRKSTRLSHWHTCPACHEPFDCCAEDCGSYDEMYCVTCYDVTLLATKRTHDCIPHIGELRDSKKHTA